MLVVYLHVSLVGLLMCVDEWSLFDARRVLCGGVVLLVCHMCVVHCLFFPRNWHAIALTAQLRQAWIAVQSAERCSHAL
jgi:hypothetical protein